MCNCIQQSKIQAQYENVKRIAKRYSKSERKICFIYATKDGYSFMEIETPESENHEALEFICEFE